MLGIYSFEQDSPASISVSDQMRKSSYLKQGMDVGNAYDAEPFHFLPGDSSGLDGQYVRLDDGLLFYFNGYFNWPGDLQTVDHSSSLETISRIAAELSIALLDKNFRALQNINGSFHILVYNPSLKYLYSITDRLRSRNIFYRSDRANFILSDEIRSLLSDYSKKLDKKSIVEFLRFTMIFGDHTLYEDVYCQPASSVICVSESGVQKHSYWSMKYDETWEKSNDEYIESIAGAFKSAVHRLINDHSGVALMLSGGLDSRMISAALTSNRESVKAVSFGGFINPEVSLARKVSNVCGFPFYFIKREPDYYANIFPIVPRISNGLYNFYHAHMLGVSEQIHQHDLHTLIHGWGLDVPFSASYIPKKRIKFLLGNGFQVIWPENLKPDTDVSNIYLNSLSIPQDQLTGELFFDDFASLWLEWPRDVVRKKYEEAKSIASDPYNQLDYMMLCDFTKFRSYIYPLSVRAIVKERCPLFDNQIIDTFLELPPRLRFCSRAYGRAIHLLNPDLSKLPYNRIGTSTLQPEIIKTISYFIQPNLNVIRKAKRNILKEFMEYPAELSDSYPNVGILLRTQEMERLVRKAALDGPIFDLEIVKKEKMAAIVEAHMHGTINYSEIITAIMTLNQWLMSTAGSQ